MEKFKNAISSHNPQFKEFTENNYKDFLKYLLKVMHEELNYFIDNNYNPQYQNEKNNLDRLNLFKNYIMNYSGNNFSIFSKLFYGKFEEQIKCNSCKNIFYRYKQFELISFDISRFDKKEFNIYDGFEFNEKTVLLSDNDSLYCNICNKCNENEYTCKIIEAPLKLLINID